MTLDELDTHYDHKVWKPIEPTTEAEKIVAALSIRVKRDKWVSVRDAEELNSAKSSAILQRTDRHGILDQKRPDFQASL